MTLRRLEPKSSLDFFPTPAWATRALFKYVLGETAFKEKSVLEPACGHGHMADPLKDYFKTVYASDIEDYGYGDVKDFLDYRHTFWEVDWVITNPPFKEASRFILKALDTAREGVAMFARIQLLEGQRKYETIFKPTPPIFICPFVSRVHLQKNKVVKNGLASTVCYAWFIWTKADVAPNVRPRTVWIPPCQKELERDEDYAMS